MMTNTVALLLILAAALAAGWAHHRDHPMTATGYEPARLLSLNRLPATAALSYRPVWRGVATPQSQPRLPVLVDWGTEGERHNFHLRY